MGRKATLPLTNAQRVARYFASPKGKATWARYRRSLKGQQKIAALTRKGKYGAFLTEEEYHERLIATAGLCEMCGAQMRGHQEPSVDHCHDRNIFRGLLCFRCNHGLAYHDDATFVVNARRYLMGPAKPEAGLLSCAFM